MSVKEQRDKLIKAMAKLEANKRQVQAGKKEILDKAKAQHESMGPALHTVEQHQEWRLRRTGVPW